ncbi:hypothetical protein MKW94_021282 [Papaver nudicaule]|uniref:Lipocalin/cytosolic fatty-acid binding domain-containing protein n=1 Tax=Papaver nudicaule TaxID=74823 RepID=A0AA41VSM2_PAPNU|nr:hypothetical protein [Papaver nudicaule]
MGRWYEIASFPSRFQPKNGVKTRATYTLQEDGKTVTVLNETWNDGKRGFIQGTAYKADPNSNEAKLKVKFWVPPFLPIIPVVGDYWVLSIDEDCQYALIGQPSRNYLWILCRNPHMDEEIYNGLLEKATSEGYDVKKLHKTPQTDFINHFPKIDLIQHIPLVSLGPSSSSFGGVSVCAPGLA